MVVVVMALSAGRKQMLEIVMLVMRVVVVKEEVVVELDIARSTLRWCWWW